MSSLDGRTSFDIKCEVIEEINSLYKDFGMKLSKEANITMSIEELREIWEDGKSLVESKFKRK